MMRRLSLALLLALAVTAAFAGGAAAAPGLVGQVTEYRLGAGTRPEAIVTGPDGNLWFAGIRNESGAFADVVGRVTPKGKVTEFTLDSHQGNLGLSDIAVGPDGNLWFTEGGRPKVGRITTAGAFTEFELPDPDVRVASIARGPDGNLWFTEFLEEKVGRITTAGEVTEFPLRGRGGAAGIVAAPDGYLWVTRPNVGGISRIATDGSETRVRLPEPPPSSVQIVVGPDGALWFDNLRSSALGRLTTEGELTEFEVPGGDHTLAISSGPSGAIWYSNGGGRIGWMVPGGPTGTPACISSCRTPISALAKGPGGKLWFAAGVGPLEPFSARGAIGTFAPPPRQLQLLGGAELRRRQLQLSVRCPVTPEGNPCKGRLRIASPGGPVQRPLSLPAGGKRRLSVRLPDATLQQLAKRGQVVLRARTGVRGGRGDSRRIVLRRG